MKAADLWDEGRTRALLRALRQHWIPRRLAALGISKVSEETRGLLSSDAVEDIYMASVDVFRRRVHLASAYVAGRVSSHCVFEGSQGLLLDPSNREFFPHLTPCSVGLANVLPLAKEMGISKLEVVYVMRAYMTRHGAGPFPSAFSAIGSQPMTVACVDPTNIPHDFQGELRLGALDLDRMRSAIIRDRKLLIGSSVSEFAGSLAVTCLDHVTSGRFSFVYDGAVRTALNEREFVERVLPEALGLPVRYISRGPTRADVIDLQAAAPPVLTAVTG